MAKKSSPKPKSPTEMPPKKPAGPYFKYAASIRPALEKEFPDLKPSELRKIANERWSELPDSEKQPMKARFASDMEEYKRDLAAFNLRHPAEKVERKGTAASKEPSPKKVTAKKTAKAAPVTTVQPSPKKSPEKSPRKANIGRQAFKLFEEEMLPDLQGKHPGASATEISKQLGTAWKNLPEDERVKYQDAAMALES